MLRFHLPASLLVIACLSHAAPSRAQQSPAQAETQPACPWMTPGSAAHALGGEVRAAVSLKDSSHGDCTFSRLEAPRSELKIFVGEAGVPSCPKGSVAVTGVGTRANQCALHVSRRQSRQMLSGAVREKAFAIVITNDAADNLKQVGEMVAGSLF